MKIEVKALDTSLGPHEEVKRQLKFQKRQDLGKQVLMDGAANLERRIARQEMRLGDVKPPILYDKTVLRKLRQEVRDKDLGLSSGDGMNPILTLQKLKYTPPYVGSIHTIGLDDFTLHVFMPEFIHIWKEFVRYKKVDNNELKNRVLNGTHGRLDVQKLFIIYWRAMQGSALIGASNLVTVRISSSGRAGRPPPDAAVCQGQV